MFAVKWWKGVMRGGFPNPKGSEFDTFKGCASPVRFPLSRQAKHLVAINDVSQKLSIFVTDTI